MIHYTCDRCHRVIDCQAESRYRIQIQMDVVREGDGPPVMDEDVDHLLELHEILESHPETKFPAANRAATDSFPPSSKSQQYDLCLDCFKAYYRNPLACEIPLSIGFSAN